MLVPQAARRHTIVPDDWLSDAEKSTPRGIWLCFVQRINSLV
jgi:hypothetical protein